MKQYNYKPGLFFSITYLLTWFPWFLSSYFSHKPGNEGLSLILMILGLLVPTLVSLFMIFSSKKKELIIDFKNRLTNFKLIRKSSYLWLLLMPAVVVISIFISLLVGQSIGQFKLSDSLFQVLIFNMFFYLIISVFEETGWRGYGFNSLLSKNNLFKASIIFALLWAFWHLPLFFIKDYYHYEIANESIWFGVNFIISVIPLSFIMSYLFKINKYSIIILILFHTISNVMQEFFQMTQIAKCVETGVLFIIALIIVLTKKELFFNKNTSS